MKITSLMTPKVVSVEMDDALSVVKEIFDNKKFHHLLVVGESKLLGVISDRDLLKSLSPNIDTAAETNKDLACLNKKVHQIMTRQPITLHEKSTIKDAVALFNSHRISCIPVINNLNEPVGIISWRDIMKEIGKRLENATK
ncbi:CBS domain-containing protein [Agarilytica rhodophyticola]|uniref:CBS domain-containing protein n=1 Tax=Agarilytica rhodophyticola TaxID=1737490 RepID=UPI000B3482F7|nr:CBS domain-containing protein [Agarilytica rhodophyticola]